MPFGLLPFGATQNEDEKKDPLSMLIASLLAPKTPTTTGPTNNSFDLGGLLKTLTQTRDPVGYANKMASMPSYYAGSQSPFNTGFFKNTGLATNYGPTGPAGAPTVTLPFADFKERSQIAKRYGY